MQAAGVDVGVPCIPGRINAPVCQETGVDWYIKDAGFQGARCSQLYLLLQHLCMCGCA